MLTARQEQFCLEFAQSGNATSAYLKAYGGNELSATAQASRLLRKDNVRARLKELADEIKHEKIADITECQELLTAIARDTRNAAADRIKAIQTLMKAQGAFVTQINFNSTPVVISGGEQLED